MPSSPPAPPPGQGLLLQPLLNSNLHHTVAVLQALQQINIPQHSALLASLTTSPLTRCLATTSHAAQQQAQTEVPSQRQQASSSSQTTSSSNHSPSQQQPGSGTPDTAPLAYDEVYVSASTLHPTSTPPQHSSSPAWPAGPHHRGLPARPAGF